MSTGSHRRSNICIDILNSLSRWAARRDVAWWKISLGTIFERDSWTHTKPRCEWRDNIPPKDGRFSWHVEALVNGQNRLDRRGDCSLSKRVNILLLQLK